MAPLEDDKPKAQSNVKAKDRLTAINRHLRDYPSLKSDGEADWSSAVREIELRRDLARIPVEDDPGYVRQKKAGKLWVRERIDAFVGPSNHFEEIGSCTGTLVYAAPDADGVQVMKDFVPSNNVFGWASLRLASEPGRRVMLLADDFSQVPVCHLPCLG